MTDKTIDNQLDEIDRAAVKAMIATNYCTKHSQYHGQQDKSCTPQERVMIRLAQRSATNLNTTTEPQENATNHLNQSKGGA